VSTKRRSSAAAEAARPAIRPMVENFMLMNQKELEPEN
jgi:hypothetical protein